MLKFHKDYSKDEFGYRQIVKAWQAINGANSSGRCFFIGQLITPFERGEWMAYLRRPDKESSDYLDVPFDYEGFLESSDAEETIFERVHQLGWRVCEMNINFLPETQ